ncbi:MAG: bifunctional (p)ppGpp synthetase/guanosine-3',5'-bis(diphosphate) 3'-pyrophosphohydrolase [Armatimonadetes bacterium]|nr:bifunctional (p)ppGpp synthetase/guanosine-3',5'-bis(diphosphate) 3'-pyrophosphohydrolase [Armatimonadota bacterium]
MSELPLLNRAALFAAEKHKHQTRDGEAALPYVAHCFEVASNLRIIGGELNEDILCAAILHDTIEDTEATYEEVAAQFGERVADIVASVTRDEPSEEETEGLSKEEIWELRNYMFAQELVTMPLNGRKIKLADRLSNVREGARTRPGPKHERYVRQTQMILTIIPRETNAALWDAIAREIDLID